MRESTYDIFIGNSFFLARFSGLRIFFLSALFIFLVLYCITKIVAYHTDKEWKKRGAKFKHRGGRREEMSKWQSEWMQRRAYDLA